MAANALSIWDSGGMGGGYRPQCPLATPMPRSSEMTCHEELRYNVSVTSVGAYAFLYMHG